MKQKPLSLSKKLYMANVVITCVAQRRLNKLCDELLCTIIIVFKTKNESHLFWKWG